MHDTKSSKNCVCPRLFVRYISVQKQRNFRTSCVVLCCENITCKSKKCAEVSIDNLSVLEFIYGNIQRYQNVIPLR